MMKEAGTVTPMMARCIRNRGNVESDLSSRIECAASAVVATVMIMVDPDKAWHRARMTTLRCLGLRMRAPSPRR
ncbi:MAG: hypothetical protein F9K44_04295 [Hyphomicrobiaceae bacterium]|nr:MAG: hypothetical protein F9K44_04295 [Hyphomicrobiaceae bacterium]